MFAFYVFVLLTGHVSCLLCSAKSFFSYNVEVASDKSVTFIAGASWTRRTLWKGSG